MHIQQGVVAAGVAVWRSSRGVGAGLRPALPFLGPSHCGGRHGPPCFAGSQGSGFRWGVLIGGRMVRGSSSWLVGQRPVCPGSLVSIVVFFPMPPCGCENRRPPCLQEGAAHLLSV